jgi:hypothetical protein
MVTSSGTVGSHIGSEQGVVAVTPPGSPTTPGIEFATPTTEGEVNPEGAPLRFRIVQNINDTTREVHDFEYSGLCF